MKKNTLLILFLLFLSSLATFSQVMLSETPLKQQIDNSSLVVEGKVISKISFWGNDGLIYTNNTVEVYKVFKGKLLETINVVTLGGAIELRALDVSSSLKLRIGDLGMFMLQESNILNDVVNKSSNESFKPYGAIQGFYKYNLYDDLATNPFNSKKGISKTFYNEITNLTNKPYAEITKFDVTSITSKASQTNKTLSPSAITFSPTTITSGTKSTITITIPGGSTGDFGSVKGKVAFSDADQGGNGNYIDALDSQVTSWTTTSITVEVPSSAGTGKIRVTNNDATSRLSTTDLTVTNSEINVEYDSGSGPNAYRVQHVSRNGTGGYTWQMQTDFFNDTEHPGAKSSFKRAFDKWVCATGINWTISSSSTTKDAIGVVDLVAPFDGEIDPDGTNVIRFDNGAELPVNNLGSCYSWYGSCNGVDWIVTELDIVFDDATNWNFSASANSTAIGQYDFESVALHELGHGHQLAHVIDTNDLMNYALSTAEEQRVIGVSNSNAATIIQTRSKTIAVCSQPLMTSASCPLGVAEDELNAAISIFPNPTTGQFYIKNASFINLEKIMIYDVSGRLISQQNISNNSTTKTINLASASKGIYFVNIFSDVAVITKKIILE